jgi:hypothetical protein
VSLRSALNTCPLRRSDFRDPAEKQGRAGLFRPAAGSRRRRSACRRRCRRGHR